MLDNLPEVNAKKVNSENKQKTHFCMISALHTHTHFPQASGMVSLYTLQALLYTFTHFTVPLICHYHKSYIEMYTHTQAHRVYMIPAQHAKQHRGFLIQWVSQSVNTGPIFADQGFLMIEINTSSEPYIACDVEWTFRKGIIH